MALDYSKLTDEQLQAIADNDYSKLPDDVLQYLADQHDATQSKVTDLSPEALAARNDPAMTAGVGAIAGSTAAVGKKSVDIASALNNLGKKQPIPVAPQPEPYIASGQKYKAKTGFGAGEGETVREVSDEWKRIEAEKKKAAGSGKISSRLTGGSPDEILARARAEEQELAKQARIRAQEKLARDAKNQAAAAAAEAERNAIAAENKYGIINRVGRSLPVTGASVGYNAMDAVNQAKEGDPLQATVAGAGVVGAAAPYIKKLPPKLRAIGTGISLAAPIINRGIDAIEEKATGGLIHLAGGGDPKLPGKAGTAQKIASAAFKAMPEQTVTNPLRNAFPGIYKRPDVIAQEAAARVAPESPALKQLFGVTRDDLYQMGKGRVGNMPGILPGAAANPKGSRAAADVMNPRNEQRLLDVLSESEKHPELVRGMDPWYIMDPAYKRLEELVGPAEAVKRYKQLNTLTGMASPGSDVLTEMNRGTAANYLATQGRFSDFVDYAGKPMGARGADFPDDLRAVMGHPYHRTAQAIPMQQYLDTGAVQMSSPKVPAYIQASAVPQTGFQTDLPVGDAHWSRAVGLADTRGAATRKGQSVVPGASVSNPEMSTLAPWWKDKIAGQVGLESVPAQARAWGAFSPQTGVESPIGAPKLELLSMKIMEAANRYGVSPEQARDMILKGEGYAGKAAGGSIQHFAKGNWALAENIGKDTLKLLGKTKEELLAARKLLPKNPQQQNPELAKAVDALRTGQISQKEYLEIVSKLYRPTILGKVPDRLSPEEIAVAIGPGKAGKGIVDYNVQLPKGEIYESRLDIPGYTDTGRSVSSIELPSGKMAYGQAEHMGQSSLISDPSKAMRVGLGTKEQAMTPGALEYGAAKSPFAVVQGPHLETDPDEIRRMMEFYSGDPKWRELGMNPYAHSQFFDKKTMKPAWNSDEVLKYGQYVLGKDPEMTHWLDPRLAVDAEKVGGVKGIKFKKGGLAALKKKK